LRELRPTAVAAAVLLLVGTVRGETGLLVELVTVLLAYERGLRDGGSLRNAGGLTGREGGLDGGEDEVVFVLFVRD
jgi:hypothetical protein